MADTRRRIKVTRHLLRWTQLPAEKRVTDAQLAREFFVLPSWPASLPADAARCDAATQGNTAIYYSLVRDGRYFRCPRYHASNSDDLCRLHMTLERHRMTRRRRVP